jgi:hypothetical protein
MNNRNLNSAVSSTTGRHVETRCLASLFCQSGHDLCLPHEGAMHGDAMQCVYTDRRFKITD